MGKKSMKSWFSGIGALLYFNHFLTILEILQISRYQSIAIKCGLKTSTFLFPARSAPTFYIYFCNRKPRCKPPSGQSYHPAPPTETITIG